uniref:NADH dehydrogenase subunit 2 n=1 Tax=Ramaria cf. rubripermanens TaxID=2016387 RepID=UPI002238CEEA|nr:NADH dehydrogenase subunit 2 [Ramaria cf. rubripermanens]UYR22183.1 NADH dehydrogenase subunit 2 [Ramaria cf. rubripermanens]
MIFLSILIFILAMSLRSFKTQITPIFFTRIAALAFIYSGVLTFNALHIQSIGSGIGIYSGLFQVTYYSLFFETFLYVIGAIILLSWPLFNRIASLDIKNISISPYKDSLRASVSSLNITEDFDLLNKTSNSLNGSGRALEFITSVSTSKESREYSLIALFSSLGGSLLLSSGDLLSMYLSIELQSFGLYILATIYRESGSATSAGLKYFLLGGLSSCLILLGIALVYTFTGLTSFESLYSLVSVLSISKGSFAELSYLVTEIDPLALETLGQTALLLNGALGLGEEALSFLTSSRPARENISQGISLGLILIVVGFLFKISAAPFHNWAPDVYDESPTNVTIWLTIMPKLSIILLLLELEMGISLNLSQPLIEESSGSFISLFDSSFQVNIINGGMAENFLGESTSSVLKNIFLLSSLLSLIIGTVVGLAQIRIKRLLAYSTVSHIGFLLLALAVSTEQSTESLIFYLIQYTITNLNAFFILLAFGYIINSLMSSTYINSDIKFIFNLKGQFLSNPILSLSLAVCLFSMAGIPPLIGFFGKQSILFAAIGNGYFFMAIVAIVVSVISASYYLRIIRDLHSESEKKISDLSSLIVSDSEVQEMEINPKLQTINKYESGFVPHISLKDGVAANKTQLILTNTHAFIIASLTLSIIFYVLKPSILLNSAVLSTLSLFYF